jgi:flagellar biosynthesis protein FlhG
MQQQLEDLRKFVELHRVEKTEKTAKTRIITIASGKGGVGKTNLAINLGIVFAKLGKRVVVMDADLGLANINVVLGVTPRFNLFHVIRGQKEIRDILMEAPGGIQIIAGASGFSELANLSEEQRESFIRGLEGLGFADIVILDTGAGISNNVMSFVMAAHDIIVVTTAEPTAITDAYGIIKSIARRAPGSDINLVVNRVTSMLQARRVADKIIGIAGQFLSARVFDLGFVYNDSAVEKSVLQLKPFVLHFPRSKASACVRQIAARLENGERKAAQGGMGQFVRNFFRFYGET